MMLERVIIPGVVENGVVVPQGAHRLPNGLQVQILLPVATTPDVQKELDGWERAGDEAWSLIDEWEKPVNP